ncbi:MAG: hypothetical protein EXQ52_13985 [Bryobacterales bacterium]|nr:hypothetical protein [Bryobacterales bacterium]
MKAKGYMMFRLLLLMSFALLCAAQDVKVSWIGQSGYIIQSPGGPTVVSDPPGSGQGFLAPAVRADAVTVSHAHGDHTGTDTVRGPFALIDGRPIRERTEVAAAGVNFVLIPGFHDNNGATPNTVIRWTQSGLRFAQFGDFGQAQITETQMADLRDLDVAFFSSNHIGIAPQGVSALLRQLRSRVAILGHFYGPLGGLVRNLTLRDVLPAFDQVVFKPSTVTLSRATLPAATEVWVMEPLANAVVVNAASSAPGIPVAPGSIATVYGEFTCRAEVSPLPTRLCGVQVMLDGKPAPLYFASPTQINFQVSSQLESATQYLAEVRVGDASRGRAMVTVLPSAPGLFLVLNADGRVNSAGAPARRGETIRILATGQGAVMPPVADGAPAPAPPPVTDDFPGVYLSDGKLIVPRSSALLSGAVGVWQIEVTLPASAPAGSQSILVVKDLVSNALPISIAP